MKTDNRTIESIRQHAALAYPEECCGFLIGAFEPDGSVLVIDAAAVENSREERRERRYWISPADFRHAALRAERAGYEIVGFYHSHPDHPALPSTTDLAEATFPGYLYAIASVTRGTPGEIRVWSLNDDRTRFEEQPAEIIADKLKAS